MDEDDFMECRECGACSPLDAWGDENGCPSCGYDGGDTEDRGIYDDEDDGRI